MSAGGARGGKRVGLLCCTAAKCARTPLVEEQFPAQDPGRRRLTRQGKLAEGPNSGHQRALSSATQAGRYTKRTIPRSSRLVRGDGPGRSPGRTGARRGSDAPSANSAPP
jgi:hypothetical protein